MGSLRSKFCKQFSATTLRLQSTDATEAISCMTGYGYSQRLENKTTRTTTWKELLLYRK